MTKQIKFYDIVWETDGEIVNLPSVAVHNVAANMDVDEEGAEYLSNCYGWLVKSFKWS